MNQQGSMRITHIGLHTVYYEILGLFSVTKAQIYNKENCKQVKVII